ncbi:MAG: trypsin-like serine protease, partial [Actinomycetota bacterium]|nr:trypsin-like serine protease [Actinomycetota bacterium]
MNRIVIALASLACTLAFAATGSAITYGQPDGNRHPNVGAMVADWRKNGHLELFCSGSLISPTVFLTAAHCTSYL